MVQSLLTIPGCAPNCNNRDGHTSLALARQTDIMRCLLKYGAKSKTMYHDILLRSSTPPSPPPSPPSVTVFTVGDKGAGKSTLAKALMTENKGISRFSARVTKVGGVTTRTAGIECHQIHNRRIGNLRLYDIAGHREFHSSHDTVIRNASSGAIFLFVIDLTATESDLQSTVFFWISFFQNQVSPDIDESCKPHLLLIGSHADRLASKSDLRRKEELIKKSCSSVSKLQIVGFLAVDCRYSESTSLAQLRRKIFEIQQSKQANLVVTYQLQYFQIFLKQVCGDQPGVQLGTIMEFIQLEIRQQSVTFFDFLPNTYSSASKLCIELNRRGIILYMQKKPLEYSWVFVDWKTLLKKVNGSVFAFYDFQKHKSLAIHTGVVPLKKIFYHFQHVVETRHMDIELILRFMIHMEICREITDSNMLEILAINYPDYKEDRHFFFPGLITESIECIQNVTSAKQLWQPTPGTTYSPHSSCWVLKCSGIQHYFSRHFLQLLLLHLAFMHSLPANTNDEGIDIPGFKQECILWKNGIRWVSSFIEVLVSIADHQVSVLMRCHEGKEGALAYTRSQVINEVLTAKKEFCGNTETSELFIPNPTFPVNTDIFVPLANVTHSIARHKEDVISSNKTMIELHHLLQFEPYMYLPTECLSDLYSAHSETRSLTTSFITLFSDAIVEKSANHFYTVFNDFCTMLGVSSIKIKSTRSQPYQQSHQMLEEWKEKSDGTLQCLREHMDKYSVFSGRNILVSINIVYFIVLSDVLFWTLNIYFSVIII